MDTSVTASAHLLNKSFQIPSKHSISCFLKHFNFNNCTIGKFCPFIGEQCKNHSVVLNFCCCRCCWYSYFCCCKTWNYWKKKSEWNCNMLKNFNVHLAFLMGLDCALWLTCLRLRIEPAKMNWDECISFVKVNESLGALFSHHCYIGIGIQSDIIVAMDVVGFFVETFWIDIKLTVAWMFQWYLNMNE